MLYWSKKVDNLGECEGLKPEECAICSEKNKPLYKMERMFILLYGFLPVGALSVSIYKICKSCNSKLKLKVNDQNIDMIRGTISSPKKLKYYWGWLIILPIILFIIWLILKLR